MTPEMTLCPQCITMNTAVDTGFSQFTCTKGDESSEQCQICVQLTDLEQRTEKAKAELANLQRQSFKLRMKFNYHHEPFIHRLPPEVSSRIFLFCLPIRHFQQIITPPGRCEFEEDSRPIQLVIGAVCHHWREIAWSTPQLWNVLCLSVSRNTHPVRSQMVQSWLQRSGQLPLYLRVSYDEIAYQHPDVVVMSRLTLRLIVDTLIAFVDRWKVLSLRMPKSLFPLLECQPETSIMLETLDLEHCGVLDFGIAVAPRKFSLGGVTPSPKRVTLASLGLEAIDLKWDNLTYFKAIDLHVSDCLELLRQAHQLVDCVFSLISDEVTPVINQIPRNVINHSLRSLSVDMLEVGEFWDNLSLPSLLRLTFNMERRADLEELLSFFHRSRCPLEDLTLSAPLGDRDEVLPRILGTLPSVHRFYLHKTSISNVLLEAFRIPTLSSAGHHPGHMLPNLRELFFSGSRSFNWPSLLELLDHQSQIQQHVCCRPLVSIEIRIEDVEGDYIDQDTLAKISDIVKCNTKLDLSIRDSHRDLILLSRRFHGMDVDTATIKNPIC